MDIMDSSATLSTLLPRACLWAAQQERHILLTGVPLTAPQIKDARSVGVRQPERVRVLRVAPVPKPEDPVLLAAANQTGLFFSHSAGMALRFGVFLRADLPEERPILVHELVHTAQYERFGGFEPFLRRYLTECLTVGYSQSSLEREAVAAAEQLER